MQAISVNCSDQSAGEAFVFLGSLTVKSQDGANFAGTGSLLALAKDVVAVLTVDFNGTVDVEGGIEGFYTMELTVDGFPYSAGSGTFDGSVSGPSFVMLLTGTATDVRNVTCDTEAVFVTDTDPTGFRETWASATPDTHTPLDMIVADEGGWFLLDTVHFFPECGAPMNRAHVEGGPSDQHLRLVSVDSNTSCSDNVWVVLAGLSMPITPEATISFVESGSLVDPDPGMPGCNVVPCGDTISLLLQDNLGNVLAYIIQRHPDRQPMPVGGVYREIQLDSAGGFYLRNLFDDFSTIPDFNPVGAELISVEFKIQDHGEATIDSILIGPDTDGDGLPDAWELMQGIDVDGDGVSDLPLPGANWLHKDIYIEIDAMDVNPDSYPDPAALQMVKDAFAAAPVSNPNMIPGITLHLEPPERWVQSKHWGGDQQAAWAAFDQFKAAHFAGGDPQLQEIKAMAYRYCVFARSQRDPPDCGIAGPLGTARCDKRDDFMLTMGLLDDPGGTAEQQAGIFMHELGHVLGLKHTGDQPEPEGPDLLQYYYKPNYHSVMNYLWTMPHTCQESSWILDYSHGDAAILDENDLNEATGLVGGAGHGSHELRVGPPVVSEEETECPDGPPVASADCFLDDSGESYYLASESGTPVDWNRNRVPRETHVCADINRLLENGCIGGQPMFIPEHLDVLTDYNDWANLDLSVAGQSYPVFVNCPFSAADDTLTPALLLPPPRDCPADLDGDLVVGIPDLLALLAAWGTDPGGPPDFDGDGNVGIRDLLALLANWGPCP